MEATRTPYTKTPADCYKLDVKRRHPVAITSLLPDKSCPGRYTIKDTLTKLSMSISKILVNNKADIVLFHSGWTELDIAVVKHIIPSANALCIATQHWVAPRALHDWEFMTGEDFGPGYRSMCRWYSMHMFEAMDYLGYEWVIRIDDDSVFPAPIPYDIVAIMEANGAEYGYRADSTDTSEVTNALPEAANYWLTAENMQPTWLLQYCSPQNISGLTRAGWSGIIFYNNFFVARISWWLQPKIQAWLSFLLSSGGFYKFRWGDAPVHTFTMGMFMSEDSILQFGFEYEHQRFLYGLNQFSQQFFGNVVFNDTSGVIRSDAV